MKTSSEELIADLVERVRSNLNNAQALKQETEEALQWKAGPEIWSALECFEHMNLFSDIYLGNIEAKMATSHKKAQDQFKSGAFGNWLAKLVAPGNESKKVKTFKSKNPNGKTLDMSIIDKYIMDQQRTLGLLDNARSKNLSKIKVATAAGNWLKIKLGDAFRVIVYHNQRHLEQAQRSFNGYVSQVRTSQD